VDRRAGVGPIGSHSPAAAAPDSSGAPRRQGSWPPRIFDGPRSGIRAPPRVLIVEDSETTRELYAWSLRAAGWRVEEVATGEAALLAAALLIPDVIILDLGLPGIDGVEVTRRLKEQELTRDIPIVVCSGLSSASASEAAKSAGCIAFVTKPYSPDDLRALAEGLAKSQEPGDAPE